MVRIPTLEDQPQDQDQRQRTGVSALHRRIWKVLGSCLGPELRLSRHGPWIGEGMPRGMPWLFPSDRHDVRTCAEHRRLALDFADGGEQALALRGIVPQAVEIASQPARAFDGHQLYDLKSGGQEIARQFARAVKERVREIN